MPSTGRLKYIAQCGHENVCIFKDFKKGMYRLCRKCKNSKRGLLHMLGESEVVERFRKFGCQITRFIGGYKGQKKTVARYRCICGHIRESNVGYVLQGKNRLCEKCQREEDRKRSLLPFESVKKYFEENGCKLISKEYHGCQKPLRYIAQCGHENQMCLNEFQSGSGRKCRRCSWRHISEQSVFDFVNGLFRGIAAVESEYHIKTRIGHQRIDIVIPKCKIAIEYNGYQHYNEQTWYSRARNRGLEYQKERDQSKYEWCKENGYTLIVIDGREWNLKKINGKKSGEELRDELGGILISVANAKLAGVRVDSLYKVGSQAEYEKFAENAGKFPMYSIIEMDGNDTVVGYG